MRSSKPDALQVFLVVLFASTSTQAAEPPPIDEALNNQTAAASFDCKHAVSSREHDICNDPQLSALDEKLANIYRERRRLLSSSGVELLKNSERSWLHFITIVCTPKTVSTDSGRYARACLTERYGDRIRQLQKVGQRLGPYVFNSIDLYSAEPAPDTNGTAAGFYVEHVAYPQIDDARSPELAAWNQRSARDLPTRSECDSPRGDSDLEYELGYANTRLISLEWRQSTYCHGAAHGFYDTKTDNAVISPHLVALNRQDVFGSGETWVTTLKQRFWSVLEQTGWSSPKEPPTDNIKQSLEADFVNPDRWLFTKAGLRVLFSAYEGGCYACTPPPVTLPWTDLRPFLSKTSIVP